MIRLMMNMHVPFSAGFQLEDQVEKFKVYDSWGALEYKFSTEVR